ncbi:MAG: hypothetical protein JW947_01520 [Sedimentisphaerales bacterium]|nr:hypothetical protein [Sedimentisphaerales bacterium]
MKTLVISVLILLMAFFSFIPAYSEPTENTSTQPAKQKEEPVKEPASKETTDANKATIAKTTADSNKVSDAKATLDPNAVKAEIEKFEGLNEELEDINIESADEISKWTRSREIKLDLALATQKQITSEFNFLREIAVKEGAVKTTAAIDGILLDRQERFKDVIAELEKESERFRRLSERRLEKESEKNRRLSEREERRSKARERTKEPQQQQQ